MRGKRAFERLALVFAFVGFALASAEIALRVADRVWPPVPAPDPDAALLGVPFQTNAQGFRGVEVTPDPQPGDFRIAVVGDAFAAGMGVVDADAYPAQLERTLRASDSPARFEVLNLGMSGLDIEHALRRAMEVGAPLRPHLYVYGFSLDDILGPGGVERRAQGAHREDLRYKVRRYASSRLHLVRALGPRWMALRQAVRPHADDPAQLLARAYGDPAKFERIERGFDGFAALGRQSGACVLVLIHTELASPRFAHPFREAYARIAAAARARGLGATESFAAYRGRDWTALRLSRIDGLPNAAGHRVLAESLYAGLRELPPGCGVPSLP